MKKYIFILILPISISLSAQWNCNNSPFTFDDITALNIKGNYPSLNIETEGEDQSIIIRIDALTQALEISTNAADQFSQINSNREIQIVTSNNNANIVLRPDGIGETQVIGKFIIATTHTPLTSTDTGTAGQIAWDENYFYVCTDINTWIRFTKSVW